MQQSVLLNGIKSKVVILLLYLDMQANANDKYLTETLNLLWTKNLLCNICVQSPSTKSTPFVLDKN